MSPITRAWFWRKVLGCLDLPFEEPIDNGHGDFDVRLQLALFSYHQRAFGTNMIGRLIIKGLSEL